MGHDKPFLNYIQTWRKASMEEKKTIVWAGFDVGKETFSASLDQVSENGKAKITSL